MGRVTILILIDGFLQFYWTRKILLTALSHNPYFNRWFSAIEQITIKQETTQWSQSLF